MAGEWAGVAVARIVRPRGRRGEAAAEILTDFPERLTRLERVYLVHPSRPGEAREVRVRRCWLSTSRGGQAIFHFEGADSIDDAERLRGLEVHVPLEERVALPRGKYFVTDLIGCEVWELKEVKEVEEVEEKLQSGHGLNERVSSASFTSSSSSASLLGLVRDVQFPGRGTPLLVVDTAEGELLVPLAEEICRRVDTAARRIEVVLPAGLRELNRPE